MIHHVAIIVFAAGLLAVACAAQSPNSRHPASDALRKQLDDDWKYWMAQYPEMATAFGYPGQNMSWTDYSQAAITSRADYLKNGLQRLASVDRTQLSTDEQANYDLYHDLLNTAVQGLVFHNDANPIKG